MYRAVKCLKESGLQAEETYCLFDTLFDINWKVNDNADELSPHFKFIWLKMQLKSYVFFS